MKILTRCLPFLLLLLFAATWLVRSRCFIPISYQINTADGRNISGRELPRLTYKVGNTVTASATFQLGSLHPNLFTLWADGTLTELSVNGSPLQFSPEDFPRLQRFHKIYLGDSLHEGANQISVKFENTFKKSGFDFRPAALDPMQGTLVLLQTIIGAVVCWSLAHRLKREQWSSFLRLLFACGCGLRLLYYLCTPPHRRGFDDGGHLEYVQAMIQSFAVPLWKSGWEMHQPPLYYAVSAILFGNRFIAGIPSLNLPVLLQSINLLFSLCSFLIGIEILILLLPSRDTAKSCAVACMAAFPALLLTVATAGNDSLSEVLTLLFLYRLLQWHPQLGMYGWIKACSIGALAILTKLTALAPVCAGITSIVILRIPIRQRITLLLVAALTFTFLCGWYFELRTNQMGSHFTFSGGIEGTPDTIVSTALSSFLQFSPLRILKSISIEEVVRPYFFESLFRSIYAGVHIFETQPEDIAQIAFIAGFLAFLPLGIGIFRDLREVSLGTSSLGATTFLWISCCCVAAMILFRQLHPNYYLQDIRLSPLLCLAISYYIGRGCGGRATIGHLSTVIASFAAFMAAVWIAALGLTS